ncbi:MAG TPA: 2-hydroxychromene-2-carboxylate isomerase [Candidatus Aquilonibacter sp.]
MLDFWFDFASPYSYVAAMQIRRLCDESGVRLRWVPFLLGPIFELQGWSTSHFNLNPWRGKYMWRDMERLTEKFELPWRRPAQFPKNCVLAARVAAANADSNWVEDFICDAFVATFGEDRDLNDERVVFDLLSKIVPDASETLRASLSEPRRSRLRANIESAKQLGLFGAPNCVIGDEIFWGEEALEDAIEWARRRVERRLGN